VYATATELQQCMQLQQSFVRIAYYAESAYWPLCVACAPQLKHVRHATELQQCCNSACNCNRAATVYAPELQALWISEYVVQVSVSTRFARARRPRYRYSQRTRLCRCVPTIRFSYIYYISYLYIVRSEATGGGPDNGMLPHASAPAESA
jgi:hypothetical protein